MSKSSDTWHRLTGKDREARTAICSVCGPTVIHLRAGSRGDQCIAVRRTEGQRSRQRGRPGLRLEIATELDALAQTTCQICGASDDLVVDHDHECHPYRELCRQCVRGRLCRPCNLGIAYLREDPALFAAALAYLSAPRPLAG